MAERQIWTDIIEAYDELREEEATRSRRDVQDQRQDRQNDPRSQLVGEEYYDEDITPIIIDGDLSWEGLGTSIKIEGEFPRRESEVDSPLAESKTVFEDRSILDSCAWYKSHHYSPQKHWGIHIKEGCWVDTASRFWKDCPSTIATSDDAVRAAFFYFFCHEFFHYLTDNGISVLGIATHNLNLYADYDRKVYWPTYSSPGAIEEALANRYLYGRGKLCHLPQGYLYNDLIRDPPGYRDFAKYIGPSFWVGRRELMSQVFYLRPKPSSITMPSMKMKPIEQILEVLSTKSYSRGHRVPIWLHKAKTKKAVRIITPFK